jgi:hypothetical protein
MSLFKKKSAPATGELEQPAKVGGKGRPTPKRSEKEKANYRPLIIKDSKEARKRDKQLRLDQQNREYEALKKGDINNMPIRDRGPEKAFIRDFVDDHFHISEIFMPLSVVMIIILMVPWGADTVVLSFVAIVIVYIFIVICVADIIITWIKCKKAMKLKFGDDLYFRKSGWTYYMAMRMLQFRKLRLPKPRPKF